MGRTVYPLKKTAINSASVFYFIVVAKVVQMRAYMPYYMPVFSMLPLIPVPPIAQQLNKNSPNISSPLQ
jgi:hypothetical protein